MAKTWQQCAICGAHYSGVVIGDCGSNDKQHRDARGQTDEDDDEK